MSLYILVEGRRTEKIIYPNWVSSISHLKRKLTPENPREDEFYIISGNGYPCIITNHLKNSIREVNEYGYDNFWIIVDADDEDISLRRKYINDHIHEYSLNNNVKVHVIIQNICIETFGLANNDYFPMEVDGDLLNFKNEYDVTIYDPSLLVKYKENDGVNSAGFHEKYLKAIFKANGSSYSKKRPKEFIDVSFFYGIKSRFENTGHVSSFNELLVAINDI